MEAVLTAAIWAAAMVLIVGAFLATIGRPVARYIEARRLELEADAETTRARALERQNAAEIAKLTTTETADLKKAQLLQQAAEARVAAEVHQATTEDRIAEERAVIAARTKGRAEAARERALQGGDGNDTARLEILVDGYKAYSTPASPAASKPGLATPTSAASRCQSAQQEPGTQDNACVPSSSYLLL